MDMDGTLVEFLNTPARYPHNIIRSDLGPDPVLFSDVLEVSSHVSRVVDRLRLEEFHIRQENWTGLVVVYGMVEPGPRGRLRGALEADGFTVTQRHNEYGVSLEVHPRQRDLIMTRYAEIVGVICEVLRHATGIRELHAEVERRLGHPLPIGFCSSQIQIFNNCFCWVGEGDTYGSAVPEAMVRLVDAVLASDVIPPLCTRLPRRERH